MLVIRRAEGDALKRLSSRQIDDLLEQLSSDKQMPRWARLLAKAPWLYRQSPIDFIPDAIPVIGRIDDKVITSIALTVISKLSPRPLWERHIEAVNPTGSTPPR